MMPIKEQFKQAIENFERVFYCMDDEEKSIYGTSDSLKFRQIAINIERCSGRPDCMPQLIIDSVLNNSSIALV